jgi:hypothetical protein
VPARIVEEQAMAAQVDRAPLALVPHHQRDGVRAR